jgi:hypothetical protein
VSLPPKHTCGVVTSVLYTADIGDGCYAMGYNGCNFTHAEKEGNRKQTELTFTTGDEVTVEFDPVSRTVAYAVTKNGDESKRYEQRIGAVELMSDSVHFCAYLYWDDEVVIK